MKIWSSQHRCLVLMMLQIQRLKNHDYAVIWHIYLPMAVSRIFVELQISRGCRSPGEWSIGFIRYRNTAGVFNVKREGCDQKFHHSNLFWGLTCVLSWNACHFAHCFPSLFFSIPNDMKTPWFSKVFENLLVSIPRCLIKYPLSGPICWVIDFIEKKMKGSRRVHAPGMMWRFWTHQFYFHRA